VFCSPVEQFHRSSGLCTKLRVETLGFWPLGPSPFFGACQAEAQGRIADALLTAQAGGPCQRPKIEDDDENDDGRNERTSTSTSTKKEERRKNRDKGKQQSSRKFSC
jgi:hypothetical protein